MILINNKLQDQEGFDRVYKKSEDGIYTFLQMYTM